MKGVNDSKYVAAIIYITSVLMIVLVVVSVVLTEYVNVHTSLFALGLGLAATTVITFVFVPNVRNYSTGTYHRLVEQAEQVRASATCPIIVFIG